jgi:hypothetical protein
MIKKDNKRVTSVIPKPLYYKLLKQANYEERTVINMIAKIIKDYYGVKEDEES